MRRQALCWLCALVALVSGCALDFDRFKVDTNAPSHPDQHPDAAVADAGGNGGDGGGPALGDAGDTKPPGGDAGPGAPPLIDTPVTTQLTAFSGGGTARSSAFRVSLVIGSSEPVGRGSSASYSMTLGVPPR